MDSQDVKLSAEVEPFIPQKKGLDPTLVVMNLSGEAGGGGIGGSMEPTPIPSYLITCYPFVQENQPNRQLSLYNSDTRWPQPSPTANASPYMAYPLLSAPQPPMSGNYAYYQIVPASCPPMVGFYPPFHSAYATSVQTESLGAVVTDCGDVPLAPGHMFAAASQRAKGVFRAAVIPKQQTFQPPRLRRPSARGLAVQKEVGTPRPDGRSRTVLLVDAAQQTDSPGGTDRVSPLQWKNRIRKKRGSHQAAEASGEHVTSEADIDSDSGYCSPKHHQAVAAAAAAAAQNAALGVDTGVMTVGSWATMASQTSSKFWVDRSSILHRGGRGPYEQRGYAQVGQGPRSGSMVDRGCSPQKRLQDGVMQTNPVQAGAELPPEPLYFEDDDEFPELTSAGGATSRSNAESAQPRLPSSLLDSLPESSPISIVHTPIPITTSVPKRAKSQRKKALAAALATAQEYSEISLEQKKLQEAMSKAAGKKSKTPVQLDLGDMLAALEKQQQAMKARQMTNTKPLSYTVGTTALFHSKDMGSKLSAFKSQPFTMPHNMLDSTAPRVKRGKEREVPKAKRPTALKKVILKEREVRKGKLSLDPAVAGTEEQEDGELSFTDDLAPDAMSQDENGLSIPSDTSLSPASQNSPYSITPVSQGSPASSGIGSPLATSAVTKIHSRRFREYCNQVLNKEIDESVTLLLQELVRFQERVYQRDPTKAKAKRRLVMGLREVTKHMKLHKIKCVIISPNCEKIQSKGGLDEALYNVIAMAREQEIPFVFALGRKALGRCVNKLVPVSVVGIFNFSGAESLFYRLVSLTEEAREAYREMVSALEQEQAEEALKSVRKLPHHMGHSRNPSAASAISFCSVISEPISEVNEQEYETNWRNMVETSDGTEAAEIDYEKEPGSKASRASGVNKDNMGPTSVAPASATSGQPGKEEGRPDDTLEWASQRSQHSTETGSLDGSSRDPHSSSITSTASTLVPGMLEEGDEDYEDEEQEEDDYAPEPVSVEVPPLSSRIESWVSETLENLQLHDSQDSSEEEHVEEEEEGRHSEEEELDSTELTDSSADKNQHPESERPSL
ncbi:selenocysteine insertion sequence-binding protein 2-like isoform X2 [Scleropages formosus]|uniref:selenocysteine insertion sequence-binding protein 2-like isoform X2 n=1 Tax=Scleropages formosus TaxID=113540 RepID=UPI0010FA8509|nr:selenocysteine insertion sequence-binding protein 2-like isoform X2 [Scleropages formosus]